MVFLDMALVTPGDRDGLLETLRNSCKWDADMIGENGHEFMWDETRQYDYEDNRKFLADTVKDIEDDEACIRAFYGEWMRRDRYYGDYEFSFIYNKERQVVAYGFAVQTGRM